MRGQGDGLQKEGYNGQLNTFSWWLGLPLISILRGYEALSILCSYYKFTMRKSNLSTLTSV